MQCSRTAHVGGKVTAPEVQRLAEQHPCVAGRRAIRLSGQLVEPDDIRDGMKHITRRPRLDRFAQHLASLATYP